MAIKVFSFYFIILLISNYLSFNCIFCWKVDPDEDRDIGQVIESRGFISETHHIRTEDDYILGVYRIINPLVDIKLIEKRKPIILQHGLLSSGADFIISSPDGSIKDWVNHGLADNDIDNILANDVNINETINDPIGNNLGFVLANLGYDVWISNSRGNIYSRNHSFLNPDKDSKFWEFTFDEMITYDTPAIIHHVLNETQSDSIGWIGHSQGTLLMFGLLSIKPEYSNLIKPFIALAPVARVDHLQSPIRMLAKIEPAVQFLRSHGGEFLSNNRFIRYLKRTLCTPPFHFICSNTLFLLMGYDSTQLNVTRLPVYAAHDPAGTSSWNMVHFCQMINQRSFSRFDLGLKNNLRKYGSPHPPEYPLDKINSTHIAFLYSSNDLLADPQDVSLLKSLLKVPLFRDYLVPFEKWNHMDFTYAMQTGYYINRVVINILREFDAW
ncbi:gastric triacylglycerol lipase-like [Panonychus citri]|uniref:gastric triacylglycerol lipase-like n=1 Tax=Panonychus citri TaxID=50023 RepID=UPI0023072264|nr:gastric triacylglycerol lipase-like [Panonychus citri]